MSYGWLTESSVLPKPGKSVKVPSSSISSLNAVIFEGEEEARRRKETSISSLIGGKSQKKPSSLANKFITSRNDGVDERNQRDLDARASERKTAKNVQTKLEEKAMLYNSIVSGNVSDKSISSVIDFEKKIREDCVQPVPATLQSCEKSSVTGFPEEDLVQSEKTLSTSFKESPALLSADSKAFLLNLSQETERIREEIKNTQLLQRQQLKARLLRIRQKRFSSLNPQLCS
ncbi:hypothetical protein IE077_000488 [Cardiosporidium cionae]|uniref:Uncharacterized protein n=1 Tax=Cardiosporidium cionae TaxID=476202 RepID=A0ABQ7J9V8_9APIC|nr:hypothetical protein IE077_000488 [Cardiosporidium cionae]|eukprot:KAF8820435.1 hypothetical protein IE077_000488 [Cardiosporidium cionae]